MKENKLRKINSVKIITIIFSAIILMAVFAFTVGLQAMGFGSSNKIPETIEFNKKKIGYTLNHYQIFPDFKQNTIRKIEYKFNSGLKNTLQVWVENKRYELLIYQFSTQKNSTSNQLTPFSNNAYFKFYQFYEDAYYTRQDTSSSAYFVKTVRYFDQNAKPILVKMKASHVHGLSYTIKNFKQLISRMYEIERNPRVTKFAKDQKQNFIIESEIGLKGTSQSSKAISSLKYWKLVRNVGAF